MYRFKTFHVVGSWCLIILGVGHLMTHLLPHSPEQENIILVMKNFLIDMPGSRPNLFMFHLGFSLMMGVLLVAYGTLNLIITAGGVTLNNQTRVAGFNVALSLIALILSGLYFFIVPIVLTMISAVSFGMAYYLAKKQTQ